jgi:Family of unknown function (DUF6491)
MEKARVIRSTLLGVVLAAAHSVAPAADDPAPPPASSAAAAPAPEAQIPFAKTNIWNWQVVDDQTVLIQDQGRRWYKAALFNHCIDLPFANTIAFDSNPGGTFDKFSAILVRGRRCPLISLVQTTAPPKKLKAKKPDPAPAPQ